VRMPSRRVRHSASAAEREFVTARPSTASLPAPLGTRDSSALNRAQSAHQIGLRRAPSSIGTLSEHGGDENAPASAAIGLPSAARRGRGYTDERTGQVIHPKEFRQALGPRVSTPNVDQTDKTRLGAVAGRLTSEDYGLYFEDGEPGGPGPGVRELYCPGVRKPLMYPTMEEMMVRRRPKPTTTKTKTSRDQEFALTHGLRSSALIGAGGRPKTASELSRPRTVAELNYSAQFLWNDPAVPPIGGLKRRSTSREVLEAVEWQQQYVDQAAHLDSWSTRLDERYSTHKNIMDQTTSILMPAHHEAYRVAERQRVRDLNIKKTSHATGIEMQREGFDSVYSDAFSNKDTESVLKSGSMVPFLDERVPAQPRERAGEVVAGRNGTANASLPAAGRQPRHPGLPKDKPLMPCRSVLGISFGPYNEPGRSIDF
jgi:hypothetical protein